jgi:hypothetical protein
MPAVKDVGEPCEGEPHARFDGGREESGISRLSRPDAGASRLPDSGLGRARAPAKHSASPPTSASGRSGRVQ